ncbi:hypothetical protein E1301_Tti019652 [Triplophysa tibetana]|uniref:Uncharacterized protein n=1 Tax=Triplophysa tibetana TaxID=1572043 RepID=A0A5A9PPK9_9TELE|nr:hypothetical protein E1301_Tti019652 [Triplophysa tibetana]
MVFAEFNRTYIKNLQHDFYDALDRYTPRFVTIFKSKKGNVGETLAEFLRQVNLEKPDVTATRTLVLRCLPVLLGDDPSNFYNSCLASDADVTWEQVSVGLMTVVDDFLLRHTGNSYLKDANKSLHETKLTRTKANKSLHETKLTRTKANKSSHETKLTRTKANKSSHETKLTRTKAHKSLKINYKFTKTLYIDQRNKFFRPAGTSSYPKLSHLN